MCSLVLIKILKGLCVEAGKYWLLKRERERERVEDDERRNDEGFSHHAG